MLRLLALALVVAGAAPSLAWSAPEPPLEQFVHRSWRREQGLPQDAVTTVLQTRDGYIWAGTQEGLVRFDGGRFTIFNRRNTPALPHNETYALAEGADGTLWIGSYGGLVAFRDGEFAAHLANQGAEHNTVAALAVGRDGTVWFGTQSAGVGRFAAGQFTFFSTRDGLPSDEVNDVAIDAQGAVHLATSRGAAVWRGSSWRTYDTTQLPASEIFRVVPTPDGQLWLATRQGLAIVDGGAARVASQPAALALDSVRSLAVDSEGRIWAGTENGMAWRWNGTAWSSLQLAGTGRGNYVWAIVEDRERSVWLGTYATGLHRIRQGRFANLTRQQGLIDDGSRVVLQTRGGDVWIASEASGLTRLKGMSATRFDVANGLPHLVVRTLFEDGRGRLWAGTRDGLASFDGTRFHLVPGTQGLSVRVLAEDAGGTLWIGTATAGMRRLVDGRLTDLADDGRTPLPRGIIRSALRASDGTLWIGTDAGLVRWRNGSADVLGPSDGLPAAPVYTIYEDVDRVLWLGTYGGGLLRMKDGTITRFTEADGLFDDIVYQLLEDTEGRLWISCNNGLFSVAKADLQAFAERRVSRISSQAYDTSDGMLSAECNGNSQPAGWKMADGRLWFPTTAGVVVVDPSNLGSNSRAPLVAVSSMAADGRGHPVHRTAKLPPGTRRIELEYAGLSFVAPERVAFRYRLDGLDADWVEAGGRRQTVYTQLAPGGYVFRVAARNNDGVWSEHDATLAFVVEPYFYQRALVQGTGLLALLTALIAGIRLRDWRRAQREQELSRRVDEAISRIKVLSGLLPICANCKKIRDDRGYWRQLEQYLDEHSEATFSHGICPGCMQQLYPEFTGPETGDPPSTPA